MSVGRQFKKHYQFKVSGQFIGEIKRGTDIGYKSQCKWIWQPCNECGFERWVMLKAGKPINCCCKRCSPKNVAQENGQWKGGRINSGGYIQIWVSSDNFFHAMATKKHYVLEHRLVMAKHLNRCLLPWEIVHHKGTKYPSDSAENKRDNRLENLELLPTKKYHIVDSVIKSRLVLLEKRITLLEAENTLLREQIQCQGLTQMTMK